VTSPLRIFVLAVLVGAIAAPQIPVFVLATIVAVGAFGGFAARMHAPRRAIAFVLIGAAAAGALRAASLPSPLPRVRITEHAGLLDGVVLRGCDRAGDITRCIVELRDGRVVTLSVDAPGCLALPGDRLNAVATFAALQPVVNDGAIGPGAGRFRQGIHWRARAAACEIVGRAWGPMAVARRLAVMVRRWMDRGIARAFDPVGQARARALIFGDERDVDESTLQAFRDSGLAHLLAVSGAHVALIASVLGALLLAVGRRIRPIVERGLAHALAAALSFPAVTVFVLATGESASAMRALAAAFLALLASWRGRLPHGESLVAASALLTFLANPAWVHDAGWQLSVVAGWALTVRRGDANESRVEQPTLMASIRTMVGEALRATARIAACVAPILALHFQRTPGLALVANIVAAPIGEVLSLPLTLATALVSNIAPLPGRWLGSVAARVLEALFVLPHAAMSVPGATLALPPPTWAQCIVLTTAGLFALRCDARVRATLAVLAALVCGPLELRERVRVRPRGLLVVTVLDVGQGDSILIDLPDGDAMLVDGGGDRLVSRDVGAAVVAPLLARHRRASLAAVIASHPHPDHITGLAAVLRSMRVDALWDNEHGARLHSTGPYARMLDAAHARSVAVLGPSALCGPARAFHGVTLEVVAPCPNVEPRASANDGSFVLRLAFGRSSVLLPGDLEIAGEHSVLSRLRRTTVLKLGHHGSRTSTSDALLDVVRPAVAVASAGHPSPFGHPHGEVIDRLRARGVPFWSTSVVGSVRVELEQSGRWCVEVAGEGERRCGVRDAP